jgi:hypothetical protein
MIGHDRPHPTTSSCVEVTMVPQADELWMVCFYTELRGRAPNGILEQIGPLGINAHGDPDKLYPPVAACAENGSCAAMACVWSRFASNMAAMIGLNNPQLRIVMEAARGVPVEKRGQYLQRVAASLELRGRFDDADVADVVKLAATGLAHQPAAR